MSRGVVSCCFSVKPKHNDSFTLFTRAEAKRNETTGASRQEPSVWGKLLRLRLFFFFSCQSNVTTVLDLICCWRLQVMKQ
jgi:hypothetical protein